MEPGVISVSTAMGLNEKAPEWSQAQSTDPDRCHSHRSNTHAIVSKAWMLS